MGVYRDAEGDPCRECAPEPSRPDAPPYRPWAAFAVACPHCAGAFNHMRFTEGESHVMKCPHCGKRSRARYPL